jgi:1-acyl-sn-glycerol-3-phosphate acyltransferase
MAKDRKKRPARGGAQAPQTSEAKTKAAPAKLASKPAPAKPASRPTPARPASKRPGARRAPAPRSSPPEIAVPLVEEASFGPPGITIDSEDVETMAVDAPQFDAGLDAEYAPDPDATDAASGAPEHDVYANDYYMRQWGRAGLRGRSEQVDEFGLDPTFEARFRRAFEVVFRKYFRVDVTGLEHVPGKGRALLVSNHSGTFPWDGVMLKTAVHLEHPARRDLRWLTEDFVFHFPFLGTFLNRIGAVRANPENAERLLARDALVAVFPEGIQGIGKLYRQRYQLQRFGRGGYVKLALRTGSVIIPTAIVGAEETNPLLFKLGWLSKLTGLPYLPVTPTFPWLGPLGLVPLPSKWKVVFGPPIDLSEHGPEGAEDAILVNRLNERVRTTIQAMVDKALASRDSVIFG